MNWNIFKPKPKAPKRDVALERHESQLTAIAKVHNQVVDLDGKLNKVMILIETVVRAANDELLKDLGERQARLFKAIASLDESLGSEIVKGLEEQRLWLRQQIDGLRVSDPHVLYDVQIHESDDRIVDVRPHGNTDNPWGASDRRPPFRIEQRYLTQERVRELEAGQ